MAKIALSVGNGEQRQEKEVEEVEEDMDMAQQTQNVSFHLTLQSVNFSRISFVCLIS